MTLEEIKALAAEKIAGQGNQVDLGNALTAIIDGLADAIGAIPAPAEPLIVEGEDSGGDFIPAEGQPDKVDVMRAFLAGTTVMFYLPQNDDGGDYYIVTHIDTLGDVLYAGTVSWE